MLQALLDGLLFTKNGTEGICDIIGWYNTLMEIFHSPIIRIITII